MKDVTLNQLEQARLQVFNSVMEYQLPRAQAAEILGISERQLRRVLAAYRRDGAAALVHGNRGRKPRNSIPEYVAASAVSLAQASIMAATNRWALSEDRDLLTGKKRTIAPARNPAASAPTFQDG